MNQSKYEKPLKSYPEHRVRLEKSKNFNGKEKNQAILKNDSDFNKEKAATEGYLEKYLTFFLVDFPFNMEDGRLVGRLRKNKEFLTLNNFLKWDYKKNCILWKTYNE